MVHHDHVLVVWIQCPLIRQYTLKRLRRSSVFDPYFLFSSENIQFLQFLPHHIVLIDLKIVTHF